MDFPECAELSEIVRKYVLAWIIANQKPKKKKPQEKKVLSERSYSEITAESIGVDLEFGKTDASALSERVRTERSEVRKHNRVKERLELAAEEESGRVVDVSKMIPRPPKPTPQQLAVLAEQAKLALARASELAGEPVIYCCAAIRKEGIHECWGRCEQEPRYRAVRGLL